MDYRKILTIFIAGLNILAGLVGIAILVFRGFPPVEITSPLIPLLLFLYMVGWGMESLSRRNWMQNKKGPGA